MTPITPEQIATWKQEVAEKFGSNHKVYEYRVDGRSCYLRSVDRDTYAMAMAKVAQAGPNKFNELIIQGIWLGGDETIRKDDRYYFGLVEFVEDLLNKKKGSLTEL